MNWLKLPWVVILFSCFSDVSVFWVGFSQRIDSNTGVIYKGSFVNGFRVVNIPIDLLVIDWYLKSLI